MFNQSPPEFTFRDERPPEQVASGARYEAVFTYPEPHGADITRCVVFNEGVDLVLQVNSRLSVENIERGLAAILEDIRTNGLYTFEKAMSAPAPDFSLLDEIGAPFSKPISEFEVRHTGNTDERLD